MSGHSHDHGSEALRGGAFGAAVAINVLLTGVEVAVGIASSSTALIADGLHNLNDAAALVIAWWAARMAKRKADERFTFGYRRAELVAALVNLTALIVLAVTLAGEAVMRLFEPVLAEGGMMALVSAAAIVVDLGTAVLLWKLSKGSLNLRAAFLHNLSDAGFSVAVLVGGLIISRTGQTWVDPVLTLALAALMVIPSLKMLKETARILMLGSPPGLDPEAVKRSLRTIEGVTGVHHLHLWQIDEHIQSVEAHLTIQSVSEAEMTRILQEAMRRVEERHGIEHGTFQLEPPSLHPDREECGH